MIKGYYDVIKCKLNIPTIQSKLQMKEITPSTEEQYIIPDEGYDGLASAMVKAVTNEIDPNILPENIRLGKSILGISGNLEPDKPDQSKTVIPTTEEQTVRADEGYELASVKVKAMNLQNKEVTITENGTTTIEPDEGYDGLSDVDVTVATSGIDTSDATATASDMASGKTAYVNGEKIIGIAYDTNYGTPNQLTTSTKFEVLKNILGYSENTIRATRDILLRNNRYIRTLIPNSQISNAIGLTADKLKKNETILDITGTYEGLDTSDATATASDMASGKTAYVNGQKLQGNIPVGSSTVVAGYDADTVTIYGDRLKCNATQLFGDKLYRSGNKFCVMPTFTQINNTIGLTADKLKKDETILGVTGTYESLDTSDATAVASDIAKDKTAYVDGVKLTGTLQVVEPVVLPDGLKFGIEESTSTDYSWLKNVDTSNMTSMYRMFGGCTKAKVIDVSNFNTSNVTGMGRMFENCFYVKNLDVSNFNTSNVTDLSSMFAQCNGLLSLDVSNFDTHNARNTYTMFNGCGKITSLDVSNFDLQKVVNANGMFSQCSLLENIDVSELKLTTATAMSGMFTNCRSLSNNSLNSILAMCIDAISLASTNKTLKYIGLSQTQAETCKTLSNWDAFVAAGWSTGY